MSPTTASDRIATQATAACAHQTYQRLIEMAERLPATRAAVVCPCDPLSLEAAVDAARSGLIEPVLIGPTERIHGTATRCGLNISNLPLIDAEGTFAAVARAAELAQHGKIDAVMNGSLHSCELLAVVVGQTGGLQPEGQISHCLVMDLPSGRDPLVVMTSVMNTTPTPDETAGIMQNAIDLAEAMHFPELRVAILNTMQVVDARLPHAAYPNALRTLANFAERVDAFDPWMRCGTEPVTTAASEDAAWAVVQRANVLVVPDLEIANLLVKALSLLVDAHAVGIVLGARVPIVMSIRAASALSNRASFALASLLADARRRQCQPAAPPSMQPEATETSCVDGAQTGAVRARITRTPSGTSFDSGQCVA